MKVYDVWIDGVYCRNERTKFRCKSHFLSTEDDTVVQLYTREVVI